MNEDLNVSPVNNVTNPVTVNFKFNNGSTKTSVPASYTQVTIKLTTQEFNNGGFVLTESGTIRVPYTGIISCIAYTYHSSTDAPASNYWRCTAIKNFSIDTSVDDYAMSEGNQIKGGTHNTSSGLVQVTAGDEIGIVCYNNNVSKITVARLSGFYITID